MKLLFVLRHPPGPSGKGQETLEMALLSAAFAQTVCLLFMGDGVLQWQTGDSSVRDWLAELGDYGIEQVYLQQRACLLHGVHTPHEQLQDHEIAPLFRQADRVIQL